MTVQVVADGENIGLEEAAAAMDPSVGEGTPETAPLHDLAGELPFVARQPVRTAGMVQAVAVVGGALALGVPRRAVLPLAVSLYAISEVAARRVTPLARPRDAQGDSLTP